MPLSPPLYYACASASQLRYHHRARVAFIPPPAPRSTPPLHLPQTPPRLYLSRPHAVTVVVRLSTSAAAHILSPSICRCGYSVYSASQRRSRGAITHRCVAGRGLGGRGKGWGNERQQSHFRLEKKRKKKRKRVPGGFTQLWVWDKPRGLGSPPGTISIQLPWCTAGVVSHSVGRRGQVHPYCKACDEACHCGNNYPTRIFRTGRKKHYLLSGRSRNAPECRYMAPGPVRSNKRSKMAKLDWWNSADSARCGRLICISHFLVPQVQVGFSNCIYQSLSF